MFKKATKTQAKLRLAISAVSGAGKSMSALRIATGIANKTGCNIAAIDTERGSLSLYADRFDFDVLELEETSVESYVKAIKAAGDAGYGVLIIDSLTHAWKTLVEEVDRLAKAKYRGNTWSAWSEGTPKQHALVAAILNYPGHLIATMRCKTEWVTEEDRNGKSRPVKIGMQVEQGKGLEYEFTMLMDITQEHIAAFSKDRSGMFQDVTIERPGENLGERLIDWLNDGAPAPEPVKLDPDKPDPDKEAALELYKELAAEDKELANKIASRIKSGELSNAAGIIEFRCAIDAIAASQEGEE